MSEAAHPVTGEVFASPVPPGTGWPGDLADAATPVAPSTGLTLVTVGAVVSAGAPPVTSMRSHVAANSGPGPLEVEMMPIASAPVSHAAGIVWAAPIVVTGPTTPLDVTA